MPVTSEASFLSRMRRASSMAISSKGLIIHWPPSPEAYAEAEAVSGTRLNGTRIFKMLDLELQPHERGDQVALHFTCAGVKAATQRVTQLALNLVLHHVTVTAVMPRFTARVCC